MAVFQPMQRSADMRWDMTCTNSAGTFAIGYCSHAGAHVDAPYHDDGHATADEAAACYARYQAEREMKFGERPDTQKKCVICEAWTTKRCVVGHAFGQEFACCEAHAKPEHMVPFFVAKETGGTAGR